MVVIRAADRGVNKEANILPHHKLKNVLLIAFLLNILTEFQNNWFPSLCILLHMFKNNILSVWGVPRLHYPAKGSEAQKRLRIPDLLGAHGINSICRMAVLARCIISF